MKLNDLILFGKKNNTGKTRKIIGITPIMRLGFVCGACGACNRPNATTNTIQKFGKMPYEKNSKNMDHRK